jgi:rhodanese-related sulfurtransferase
MYSQSKVLSVVSEATGKFAAIEDLSKRPDWRLQVAKPNDTLMLMCRSGGRSAIGVNFLAKAGFTHVYNTTDGMEGDEVDDPGSVFHGMRLGNGWKIAGCPWTCKLTPDRMLLPKPRQLPIRELRAP